jgi:hypothetical protein
MPEQRPPSNGTPGSCFANYRRKTMMPQPSADRAAADLTASSAVREGLALLKRNCAASMADERARKLHTCSGDRPH